MQPQVPVGAPSGAVVGVKHMLHNCCVTRSCMDETWESASALAASAKSRAIDMDSDGPAGNEVSWYHAPVSTKSRSPAVQLTSRRPPGTAAEIRGAELTPSSQIGAARFGRNRHVFSPQSWTCMVRTPGLISSTCSGFPRSGLARGSEFCPKNAQAAPVGFASGSPGKPVLNKSAPGSSVRSLSAKVPSTTKLEYQVLALGDSSAAAVLPADSEVQPAVTALELFKTYCDRARRQVLEMFDEAAGVQFFITSNRNLDAKDSKSTAVASVETMHGTLDRQVEDGCSIPRNVWSTLGWHESV